MRVLPLFPDLPEGSTPPAPPPVAPRALRLALPVRNQVEVMMRDLDSLVAPDHPARVLWALVERLDLTAFYLPVRAATDTPGRPATAPQVLLGLWLYATVEGIGSGRELDRLCHEHDAFRWLRGNVPVNYHLLSDFRVAHGEALDRLMTEVVAVLVQGGVVDLKGVAQDGVRVRASAGSGSFRREKSLRACLAEAEVQVARLAKERDHPDPEVSRREQAARERAAKERRDRVEEALRQLPEVQAVKERQKQRAGKRGAEAVSEARVSTTDPDARVMKQADGGFRPAYNVQFATDVASGVVVGMAVTNHGADQGEALPMEEQVSRRTGRQPAEYLMDGGFVDWGDIRTLERRGTAVYAPVRERAATGPSGGSEIEAWQARMATAAGKTRYKDRAATAEWVNAQARERHGLRQVRVRGTAKVRCVVLLVALAHNLGRWTAALGRAVRGPGAPAAGRRALAG